MRKVLAGRVAELERSAIMLRSGDGQDRSAAMARQVEREIAEAVLGSEETLARYGPPEPILYPEPGEPCRELSPQALEQFRRNLEGCSEAAEAFARTGVLVTASRRAYFGTTITPGSERPIRRG